MFWQKNFKNIADYPEEWKIIKATDKGTVVLIISINTGLSDAVGHPDYPIRMGVAVPVTNLAETNPLLNTLADRVTEILKQDNSGVPSLTISSLAGQPFKEFVFYTKRNVDFKKIYEDLKKQFSSFEVQMYAENDPGWSVYKEYLKK